MSEFHKPFIKDLFFIAAMTLGLMISVRYFLYNYHFSNINSPSFASEKSQDEQNSREKQLIQAKSH